MCTSVRLFVCRSHSGSLRERLRVCSHHLFCLDLALAWHAFCFASSAACMQAARGICIFVFSGQGSTNYFVYLEIVMLRSSF